MKKMQVNRQIRKQVKLLMKMIRLRNEEEFSEKKVDLTMQVTTQRRIAVQRKMKMSS